MHGWLTGWMQIDRCVRRSSSCISCSLCVYVRVCAAVLLLLFIPCCCWSAFFCIGGDYRALFFDRCLHAKVRLDLSPEALIKVKTKCVSWLLSPPRELGAAVHSEGRERNPRKEGIAKEKNRGFAGTPTTTKKMRPDMFIYPIKKCHLERTRAWATALTWTWLPSEGFIRLKTGWIQDAWLQWSHVFPSWHQPLTSVAFVRSLQRLPPIMSACILQSTKYNYK